MPLPEPHPFLDLISDPGFWFDRLEFLFGLLVGGSASYVYNKTIKKYVLRFAMKGKNSQAAPMVDSPHATSQMAQRDASSHRDGGISLSVNDSPHSNIHLTQPTQGGLSAVALTPRQKFVHEKLYAILQAEGQSENFSTRYQKGIELINARHAQPAAAEYYGACILVRQKLEDVNSYRDSVPRSAHATLRLAFQDLEKFVGEHSEDIARLDGIVAELENSFTTMSSHLL